MSDNKLLDAWAKALDVHEGDKIEINNNLLNPFTLTAQGLLNCYGKIADDYLVCILRGERTFRKLPWKPKDGEKYLYFNLTGDILTTIFLDCSLKDAMCITLGNYGRTEAELRAKEPEILKAFGLTEWRK